MKTLHSPLALTDVEVKVVVVVDTEVITVEVVDEVDSEKVEVEAEVAEEDITDTSDDLNFNTSMP